MPGILILASSEAEIHQALGLDGVPPTLTKGNFVTDTDTSNVSVVAKSSCAHFSLARHGKYSPT